MRAVEILFWCGIAIVFYTYAGYGILLYLLIRLKKHRPSSDKQEPEVWPDITLLIAAYNEEEVVDAKMSNCRSLDYPAEKLKILWITDGSNDHTNDKLAQYPEISVYYQPERKGKTAALNRAMPYVETPITVFTDANTMLNAQALKEIVKPFENPGIGCVAGEKRIAMQEKDNATSGGEGFYWKYESKLKAWDSCLYTAVGAAGELYAIRTPLFDTMPEDTLLDDFILSMRIAEKGYKIAYCQQAYALEEGSADIKNEEKRKIRIAAGGLQAIGRLRSLLFPRNRHGWILWFQYISHRVLRWSVAPIALFLLFPLNLALVLFHQGHNYFYNLLLVLQVVFYVLGIIGAILQKQYFRIKIIFIPYYFLFMNLNVLKAFFYLKKHRGKGTWEKAQRSAKNVLKIKNN